MPVSPRVGQVGGPVEIFAVALRRGLRHDPAAGSRLAAWRALRTTVVAGGRDESIPRKNNRRHLHTQVLRVPASVGSLGWSAL